MTVPKSKVIANKKYRAKTYDTIGFDVPKGKREEYKQTAASLGLSLARFLFLAAEEFGKANHAGENFRSAPMNDTQPKLSQAEQKLISDFNRLPADTQKAIAKLIQTINQNQA